MYKKFLKIIIYLLMKMLLKKDMEWMQSKGFHDDTYDGSENITGSFNINIYYNPDFSSWTYFLLSKW